MTAIAMGQAPSRESTSKPSTNPAANQTRELPGKQLSPEDEKAVRALLIKLRDAVQKGDDKSLLALMSADEAKLAKPNLEADKAYTVKIGELLKAAKAKNVTLPMGANDGMQSRLDTVNVPDNQLSLRGIGSDFAVGIPPEGRPIAFRKVDGEWKYSMEFRDAKSAASDLEMTKAFTKYAEEMTKGIKDGSITTANLEKKAREIMGRTVGPVMDKMWDGLTK